MRLWVDHEGIWKLVAIGDSPVRLASPSGDSSEGARGGIAPALATAVSFLENGRRRLALVLPPGAAAAINGQPSLAVTVLADRDEITVEKNRVYFSAHSPTEPEIFVQKGWQVCCPRCASELQPGDTVVGCPACLALHHEGPVAGGRQEDRRCWSYDPKCASCGRLREQLTWSPQKDGNDEISG